MPKQVVILSGKVGSGKTTLARQLEQSFEIVAFKTIAFLRKRGQMVALEREAFQEFGEQLDGRTNGRWVAEDLFAAIEAVPDHENKIVVLDSVRMLGQVDAIRKTYGRRVVHVHLDAEVSVLKKRYSKRKGTEIKELSTYDQVQRNKTESKVPELQKIADVVILTDRCTEKDVLVRVASHLGLYGREYLRLVDVLIGGEYGSEGKGQIAAYLSSEYDLLIRVGGPNAGHKVYEEPKPFTFHQLPSGTRSSQAKLLIGAGAVINLDTIMREIAECQVSKDRLAIDPQAMIISAKDRKREEILQKRIGSTGQGVGQATARRVLRQKDVKLARDILELRPFLRSGSEVLEECFRKRQRVLLEGTQGMGLSLYHGHYPHVTSRDTTAAGCLAEAGISSNRVQRVILVSRTYPIRVQDGSEGTSGYMSQEISWKEVARRSGHRLSVLLKTERTSTTNRQRRVGEFDWELLHRAASLNAPTDIALTFVDYIAKSNTDARRFEQLTTETIRFVEEVERVAAAPVSLLSTRFHTRSIIDRRMW